MLVNNTEDREGTHDCARKELLGMVVEEEEELLQRMVGER